MQSNPFERYAFVRKDTNKERPPVRDLLTHVQHEDARPLDVEAVMKNIYRIVFEMDRGRPRTEEARIQNRYVRHLMRQNVSSYSLPTVIDKFERDIKQKASAWKGRQLDQIEFNRQVETMFAGTESVIDVIRERERRFDATRREGQLHFIGTNDALDAYAERKIDLIDLVDTEGQPPAIDFIQVKRGVITPEEIENIHKAHAEYHRLLLTERDLHLHETTSKILERVPSMVKEIYAFCDYFKTLGNVPTKDVNEEFIEMAITDSKAHLTPADICVLFKSDACQRALTTAFEAQEMKKSDADRKYHALKTSLGTWARNRDVTHEELEAIEPDWKRKHTDLILTGTYRSVIVMNGKELPPRLLVAPS